MELLLFLLLLQLRIGSWKKNNWIFLERYDKKKITTRQTYISHWYILLSICFFPSDPKIFLTTLWWLSVTESLDSSSDINQIHWTAFLAELNKAPIRKQLNLTWPGFTRCPTKQEDRENRWAIARKTDGIIPESLLWPNTSPVGRLRSWNIRFLGSWPDDALWNKLTKLGRCDR